MKKRTLAFLLVGFSFLSLKAQIITTVAGDGTASFSGDGGQATAAGIDYPWGTKVDAAGNLFISIIYDDRIRKVNTSGVISTVAGNGTIGFSGDGGQATAAEFKYCHGITINNAGNLLEGDGNNGEIRSIDTTTGIITDFAGNGTIADNGDGGQATAAAIEYPFSTAVDAFNNVYVSSYAQCIRMVNSSGIISTAVGNHIYGYSGDGGPATAAEMGITFGMTIDNNNNLYFVDEEFNTVRKVNTSGIISTIAGIANNAGYSGDGGPATAAEIHPNYGSVAVDASGNVFLADYYNNCVREISASGIISTVVGNGTAGFSGDGGPATAAELNGPNDITLDGLGNLYITDANNNRIRKISGLVTGVQPAATSAKWWVYPNPGNGLFTIMTENIRTKSMLEVYNVLGERIYSAQLNASATRIDLSNCASGIYFYKIFTETSNLFSEGKMIIQK